MFIVTFVFSFILSLVVCVYIETKREERLLEEQEEKRPLLKRIKKWFKPTKMPDGFGGVYFGQSLSEITVTVDIAKLFSEKYYFYKPNKGFEQFEKFSFKLNPKNRLVETIEMNVDFYSEQDAIDCFDKVAHMFETKYNLDFKDSSTSYAESPISRYFKKAIENNVEIKLFYETIGKSSRVNLSIINMNVAKIKAKKLELSEDDKKAMQGFEKVKVAPEILK